MCLTLLRCHQFVDVQPICDKGVINSLNLSYLLRPQLLISNISQIQFSTTSERTGLNTVCTRRLGEQKQQHRNIGKKNKT